MVILVLGSQNVAISKVLLCFSKDTFSAGAFLMNSVQDFNGKSYAVVGPKSSKQWKSFCENDISGFLCFFDG